MMTGPTPTTHPHPQGDRRVRTWGLVCVLVLGWFAGAVSAQDDPSPIDWHAEPRQGALVVGQSDGLVDVSVDGEPVPVTDAGQFVLGLGKDASEPVQVDARWRDGRQATTTLTPKKRAFQVQRIDGLDQDMVTPPAETLARIRAEAAQARQARQIISDHTGFAQPFVWPVKGPITGVYGSQRILNGEPRAPHWGIDIAASTGTPVVSPADGQVVLVHEDMYFSGGTLFVDHGHGVMSAFLHLDQIDVDDGQSVTQGERLGTVGASGRATGPHLDWRVSWRDVRVDAGLLVPPQ